MISVQIAGYHAEACRALHELFVNDGEKDHPTRRPDPETPSAFQGYRVGDDEVVQRQKRFVLTDGVEQVIMALRRNEEVSCGVDGADENRALNGGRKAYYIW